MRWGRGEQMVTLIAAAAIVLGSLLVAFRKPAPAVRLIEPAAPADIVVQIDGEVIRPGLYRLPRGARVGEAITAAGGLTAQADPAALNLARLLKDGERLTVPRPGAPQAGLRPLDLNTATAAELEALPGIGPVLARRIVAHRAARGAFSSLEDLLQVEGIGPRLLSRLRPLLAVP